MEVRRALISELLTAYAITQKSDLYRSWFAYQGGKQTEEQFLAEQLQPNYHQFSVMVDNEFVALITYVEYRPHQFLVDCTAQPGKISKEDLASAIFSIGCEMFDAGAERCSCWSASFNRHTKKLARLCGLTEDGLTCLCGEFKGRLVRSIRFSVTSAEHYRQRKMNDVLHG